MDSINEHGTHCQERDWPCWWNHYKAQPHWSKIRFLDTLQYHDLVMDLEFGFKRNCSEYYLHRLATEMWKDLKDRFSQSNGPSICQLKKLIFSLTQETSSASSYGTQLLGYWDELANYRSQFSCSCRSLKSMMEYQQQESVLHFLMGLNDSLAHVRGQILLLEPLPSINKVLWFVAELLW